MKHILVIVFSNLTHDSRVKRQINILRKQYQVTVLCFEGSSQAGATIIRLKKTRLTPWRKAVGGALLITGFYEAGHRLLHDYDYIKSELAGMHFDLVVANDVEALPLAFALSENQKVLFDAHEYAPRHFEDKMVWRIFFKNLNEYLCRKYIPRTVAMTTIGKGLADEYRKNFNAAPVIITNATQYVDLPAGDVAPDKIRMVYHGIANPSRKLELMVTMMQQLDQRFTLDMILMTSEYASSKTKQYIQDLKRQIQDDSRIRILPPLPSHEVVSFINRYDLGIFLIPPINFNYANTLPNKLFEFIQARLGVAVGPTPEMAGIVNTYGNGVVSDDFRAETLATKLKLLTAADIQRFKEQSAVAAKDLCAEKNETVLLQLVDRVIHDR